MPGLIQVCRDLKQMDLSKSILWIQINSLHPLMLSYHRLQNALLGIHAIELFSENSYQVYYLQQIYFLHIIPLYDNICIAIGTISFTNYFIYACYPFLARLTIP